MRMELERDFMRDVSLSFRMMRIGRLSLAVATSFVDELSYCRGGNPVRESTCSAPGARHVGQPQYLSFRRTSSTARKKHRNGTQPGRMLEAKRGILFVKS